MLPFKSAKIYFCFAVLLLVAKPFLGFAMFSRVNPPAFENIFVKAFTKRKQEYAADSHFDMAAIQQKLASPVKQLLLRFSLLLDIIFPSIFNARINITDHFLRGLQFSFATRERTYLLNGKILI